MFSCSLQFPADLTIGPMDDNLDGLYSIMMVLQTYESLLSDNIDKVSQVKTEISSLTRYIDHWRVQPGLCRGEQPSKANLPGHLEILQSQKEFTITVSMEALKGVKEYLNNLLNNLDRLQIC
ncbi:leptin-like [Thalassophryne amazonica]|uniref:leptin-like n=1 Tax=Thalassophryne amazonica TaxID=390379 RepID=UPI001471A893|nr:leptin-like [Thalassophryne amazonica]